MKKFWASLVIALVLGFFAYTTWAGMTQCYVVSGDQAGETMGRQGSGVSLVGTIDMNQVNAGSLTGGFYVPTINVTNSDTDTTGPSGATVVFRYALSGELKTTSEWEALGLSGTTAIATRALTGGTTPFYTHAVTLPVGKYLAIFQEPLISTVSAYQVSTPTICFH
jgi:hypothetical protein